MGADKPSLDAGGERFLERAIRILAACCDPVVVVVEEGRDDLTERAVAAGAVVRVSAAPERGPIGSIATALEGADWDAFLLLPVDHPAVRPDTVRAVADAAADAVTHAAAGVTTDALRGSADGPLITGPAISIVVPVVGDRSGHPPAFTRAIFPELLDPELEGGARTVLHRELGRVLRLELEDPGIVVDLDTAEDWASAITDGAVRAPAPIGLAQAAAQVVTAVENGREALLVTRLHPLPPAHMVLTASRDRSRMESWGTFGSPTSDAAVREHAAPLIAGRRPEGVLEIDGMRLYAEAHRPRPELVVVGAGHISLPMARVGAVLGFSVRVLDDRPEFARSDRFDPGVEVHRVDFADAFREVPIGPLTHLVLVTRGHRYDYECLLQLLRRQVRPRYIGLIGSRRRVRATFVQLRAEGVADELLQTIRAPVGLDLGAETPGEIAIAVGAEIVREWRGGTGDPLREKERILERFFKPSPGAPE